MENESVTKTEFYNEINKLVTKEDFQAELKKLATKEDLKKFATKEDLKNFATKEDLKKTNKELEKLNGKFDRLSSLVLQNTAKLDLMETKEEANERFNQTMNRLDYIVGVLDNMRTEMASMDHGLTRVETKVDQEKDRNDEQDEKLIEQEGRILKIEAQVAV